MHFKLDTGAEVTMFKMLCLYKLGQNKRFKLPTTVCTLKPVQQYGRLKTVTMEMEKLYLQEYLAIANSKRIISYSIMSVLVVCYL